jgi:hypothetical protein
LNSRMHPICLGVQEEGDFETQHRAWDNVLRDRNEPQLSTGPKRCSFRHSSTTNLYNGFKLYLKYQAKQQGERQELISLSYLDFMQLSSPTSAEVFILPWPGKTSHNLLLHQALSHTIKQGKLSPSLVPSLKISSSPSSHYNTQAILTLQP